VKKFVVPLLTAAVVITLVFTGCVPGVPAEEPPPEGPPPEGPPPEVAPFEVTEWHLPILIPQTGMYASYGAESEWAIKEAVKDINAAGGVAGKPLKVTFYDSGSEYAPANASTARILDTKPLMVSITVADPGAKGALPLIADEKVMSIGPCSGAENALEYRPWNVLFMGYDENCCGAADIEWLRREPDIKTVVPLYDNAVEWYVLCNESRIQWLEEAGITVLEGITFQQATTVDYGPIAIAALETNADGYIFTCYGDPVAKTIIELHRRGMTDNRRISIPVCADYPELYEVGEGYIDDCYVTSFYDINDPSERWQSLKARYEAYTDIPLGFGAAMGYDVAYYFKYCIEATGVTGDPDKLAEERQILAEFAYNVEDFPFLVGTCDVVDGIELNPFYLSRIENNQKVLIEVVPSPGIPAKYR